MQQGRSIWSSGSPERVSGTWVGCSRGCSSWPWTTSRMAGSARTAGADADTEADGHGAPLSRLGPLRLRGVYWHCETCGTGEHVAASLVEGTLTPWMRELVTLLGVALAGFDKASKVSKRV